MTSALVPNLSAMEGASSTPNSTKIAPRSLLERQTVSASSLYVDDGARSKFVVVYVITDPVFLDLYFNLSNKT